MTYLSNEEGQKWQVYEEDEYILIIPDFDSKPHGFSEGKEKTEIAWLDCPCKPQVKYDGNRPTIIHNSFIDAERVENSLKANNLI